MRAAGALIVVVALAVAAGEARADDETSEDNLVRRGVAAREQGQDQAALELFREAFTRHHTPRARAQMGLALQALGRWGEADEQLRAALGAAADPWIQSHADALGQALAVIAQHVGALEVLTDVAGAELHIDGRRIGGLPLAAPLRVSAGTVVVDVTRAGHAPVRRSVMVLAGGLTRESFELVPLPRVVPAPSLPPTAVSRAPAGTSVTTVAPNAERPGWPATRRPLLVGAAVLTLVLGALALWSGADTLSARDRYVTAPTEQGYRDGVSRQQRTNWLLGGTAALGLATAGLGLSVLRW